MSAYRLYSVDGLGKFTAADWIEADSDGQALEVARDRAGAVACEIWDRGRFVGRVSTDRSDAIDEA